MDDDDDDDDDDEGGFVDEDDVEEQVPVSSITRFKGSSKVGIVSAAQGRKTVKLFVLPVKI